jgi:hypothetical protein
MNKTMDGVQCTLVIYVDDILVLSKNEDHLQHVIKLLESKFEDVKSEVSDDFSYLGMRVQMKEGEVHLSMDAFVDNILKEFGETKGAVSPALANTFELTPGEELSDVSRKKFHKTVAQLLYLTKRARPDMLVAVSFLCTRVRNPTRQDWKKLERAMGYLARTKETGLKLSCRGELRTIGYMTQHLDATSTARVTPDYA